VKLHPERKGFCERSKLRTFALQARLIALVGVVADVRSCTGAGVSERDELRRGARFYLMILAPAGELDSESESLV
jgi:hypothetical protein